LRLRTDKTPSPCERRPVAGLRQTEFAILQRSVRVINVSHNGHIRRTTEKQEWVNTVRKLYLALPALACALSSPALADDEQAWGTATINVRVAKDVRVQSETTARTGNARGFYELESSLLVGFKVAPKVTYWAGYVHNPTYSHGDFVAMERRLRQQVTVDNIAKIGPFSMNGRMRLETRWRDNVGGTGWRLRPQVKLSTPIAGKTALNISHESFINLNSNGFQRQSGYERMRNAISISTPLAKNLTIEGGYLEQHGFVRRGPDTDDHVATLALTASF